METTFNLNSFDVEKFDKILEKGLCQGLGNPNNQVCIEAAICQTLGLPHSDDPGCVSSAVRAYKIRLNDSCWSSPAARAKGLRALGIAQLGSKGVVSNKEFGSRMATETIRVLLPALIRDLFPTNEKLLGLALACEQNPTEESTRNLQKASAAEAAAYTAYHAAEAAAYTAYHAAEAAAYTAYHAAEAAAYTAYHAAEAAAYTAYHAAYAAYAAAYAKGDKYLLMSAAIALQILKDLKSPGVELL